MIAFADDVPSGMNIYCPPDAVGPPSYDPYPLLPATSTRITKETDRSQNKSGFVVRIPLASCPYASFSKPILPSTTLSKLRSGNVLRPASAGEFLYSAPSYV